MASVYNLEPQPTAKVLLTTTSGDILLELFAKQTPLASRSFLQHCLDGYYTDTLFHRVVPNFILQGGDPTNTGEGGESIYPGGVIEDEYHPRLKWNRRGLLGMANEGRKNTNGSQFFMTLSAECRELEGRNTLFGRVVGDTIFNVVRMGDADLVEGGERPLFPTKVVGCEVLVNPFENMVKREMKRVEVPKEERKEVRSGKKKGAKVLLSFGADEGEEETNEVIVKKEKYNPKLIRGDGASKVESDTTTATHGSDEYTKTLREKTGKTLRQRSYASRSPPPKVRPAETQLPLPKVELPSRSPSSSPEPAQIGKMSNLLDKTNAQIAELKASMKRNVQTAPAAEAKPKSALEQLIPATASRGRKRKHGAGEIKQDQQTLKLLSVFKSKLEKAPPEIEATASPNVEMEAETIIINNNEERGLTEAADDEEAALCDLHFVPNCQSCRSWDQHMSGDAEAKDDEDKGWMSHALSFEKDRLGKDLTWKQKNEEELVVIDPREKAKDIRDEQRMKKMAKIGGSTAWAADRDRGRAPEKRAGEKG